MPGLLEYSNIQHIAVFSDYINYGIYIQSDAYVYYDYGIGFFNDSFSHYVDVIVN